MDAGKTEDAREMGTGRGMQGEYGEAGGQIVKALEATQRILVLIQRAAGSSAGS